MKIIDLYERHQQQTTIMYHGTSDKYLRSILKHGLLANPPQRTYDKKHAKAGYETYGGLYLTPRQSAARIESKEVVKKVGGRSIIIAVQYVLRSGNVDEDIITSIVANGLDSIVDSYGDDKRFDDTVKSNRSEIVDTAVTNAIIELEEFAKLGKPILQTLNKVINFILDNVDAHEISNYKLMKIMVGIPEFKQLIEILMNNIYPTDKQNAQVLRDIKFSGKTKILHIEDLSGKILWKNGN